MQSAQTEAVSDQGPEEKLPLIESRPSVKSELTTAQGQRKK